MTPRQTKATQRNFAIFRMKGYISLRYYLGVDYLPSIAKSHLAKAISHIEEAIKATQTDYPVTKKEEK